MVRAFHRFALAVAAAACLTSARAGVEPMRTLVVLNGASQLSRETGARYARLRGIPERQLVHLHVTPANNISLAIYSNAIEGPIAEHLHAAGLTGQINTIVFSTDFPYRVVEEPTNNNRFASLTSTMFYGFHASPKVVTGADCQIAPGSANAYFADAVAFDPSAMPGGRYRLCAMLAGWNGDEARRLAVRARSADGAAAPGMIALLRTTDPRNVRWPQFEEADFQRRFGGESNDWQIIDASVISGRTNLAGELTGYPFAGDAANNQFLPGAYADHLTSFGGFLFDPAGQSSILDWIRAGVAGSYGSVVEPCAYTEKFTDARLHTWYEQGFSLGEAVYMSIQNPYQGVFVGDPLTRPYASGPVPVVTNLAPGATISGVITIAVAAVAASPARPVDSIDLWLDDRERVQVVTNGPPPGNEVLVAINGVTATYVVASGTAISDVAAGVASALTSAFPFVRAGVLGDRVQLVHTNFGSRADTNTIIAWTAPGTAAVVTIHARSASATFVDPPFPAREILALDGVADTGDVVQCIITLTNGVIATNAVVAAQGESAGSILGRLQALINADAALSVTSGVAARNLYPYGQSTLCLEARTPGPAGARLLVEFDVQATPPATSGLADVVWDFTDSFNDNESVLHARAQVVLSVGETNAAGAAVIDTALLPDGPLGLRVVAVDGTAARVPGETRIEVVVDNHDLDVEIVLPEEGAYVPDGVMVTGQASVVIGSGAVTQLVWFLEGKSVITNAGGPYAFAIPTTNLGIGPVSIHARVWSDAGESAVSAKRGVVVYTDADGDGMPDAWEFDRLGSATNTGMSTDSDGDGARDPEEFLADTDPGSTASVFRIVSASIPAATITAPTATTRFYRIWSTSNVLDGGAWIAVSNRARGVAGLATWGDTNAPGSVRSYRVTAELP